MRMLLVGPPGSGKGTQSHLLQTRLRLTYFGMGDLLREAMQRHSAAGEQARSYVNAGQLVPDPIVNDMIVETFHQAGDPSHFVMDGYPRTRAQAKVFDQFLDSVGLNLQVVVELLVDENELVKRLSGRRVCPNMQCEATYHIATNPPAHSDICDECQTPLQQREDDREETIRRRLKVYRQNNEDLLAYYHGRGLLKQVNGEDEIENIYSQIEKILHQVEPASYT